MHLHLATPRASLRRQFALPAPLPPYLAPTARPTHTSRNHKTKPPLALVRVRARRRCTSAGSWVCERGDLRRTGTNLRARGLGPALATAGIRIWYLDARRFENGWALMRSQDGTFETWISDMLVRKLEKSRFRIDPELRTQPRAGASLEFARAVRRALNRARRGFGTWSCEREDSMRDSGRIRRARTSAEGRDRTGNGARRGGCGGWERAGLGGWRAGGRWDTGGWWALMRRTGCAAGCDGDVDGGRRHDRGPRWGKKAERADGRRRGEGGREEKGHVRMWGGEEGDAARRGGTGAWMRGGDVRMDRMTGIATTWGGGDGEDGGHERVVSMVNDATSGRCAVKDSAER
ncbi:hypothetical protein DFH09DRAFT_1289968 [Mycena vulgaris]|nr:hypothetical protein DFH09DRAFT_1289968 [Mycena vulgaris]